MITPILSPRFTGLLLAITFVLFTVVAAYTLDRVLGDPRVATSTSFSSSSIVMPAVTAVISKGNK